MNLKVSMLAGSTRIRPNFHTWGALNVRRTYRQLREAGADRITAHHAIVNVVMATPAWEVIK